MKRREAVAWLACASLPLTAGCSRGDPACDQTLTIPEPRIPERPSPFLHASDSDLRLGVDMSLESVEALIEANIPHRFEGTIPDPSTALSEDQISWTLDRGTPTLSPGPDGALRFTMPVTRASATLSGVAGIPRRYGGVLGRANRSFSQTVELVGTISGTIRPKMQADWSVDPELDLQLELTRAGSTLFGQPMRLDGPTMIEQALDRAMRSNVAALNERLRADPRLKASIYRAWQSMHRVVRVSDNPPLWLVTTPTALKLADPRISEDHLRLRFDARVATQVFLQEKEPPVSGPGALPPLTPPTATQTGFALTVPVALRLSDFRLDQVVNGPARYDDGTMSATFNNVRLSGDNGRLVVGADIVAQHRTIPGKLCGRVYFVGAPRLDPGKMTLSVDRFDYSVASRNALVRSANWLLRPLLVRQIQRRAVFHYSRDRLQLMVRANEELVRMKSKFPAAIGGALSLKTLDVTDLAVDDDWVTAMMLASGPAEVTVRFDPQAPVPAR